LCWTALQPAFVIWSMSGLENPLYVFLISCLFAMTLTDVTGLASGQMVVRRRVVLAGVLAAAIALTRPDGLIYVVAYPVALLVFDFIQRRNYRTPSGALLDWIKHLAIYGASYSIVFGAFLASRVMHFH